MLVIFLEFRESNNFCAHSNCKAPTAPSPTRQSTRGQEREPPAANKEGPRLRLGPPRSFGDPPHQTPIPPLQTHPVWGHTVKVFLIALRVTIEYVHLDGKIHQKCCLCLYSPKASGTELLSTAVVGRYRPCF